MTAIAPLGVRPPLTDAQQALVANNYAIIDKAAKALARYKALTTDELRSHAREGLVDAAYRFDPSLNVPFESYAWVRVVGAIRSGLRAERRHRRALAAARIACGVYAENTVDMADPFTTSDAQTSAQIVSLCEGFAAAFFMGWLREGGSRTDDPVADLDYQRRALGALTTAIGELPERDKNIVERHWRRSDTLEVIASDLGINYSTLRRYHHAALKRLGARLRARGFTSASVPPQPR